MARLFGLFSPVVMKMHKPLPINSYSENHEKSKIKVVENNQSKKKARNFECKWVEFAPSF